MKKRLLLTTVLAFLGMALAGCGVAPEFRPKSSETPQSEPPGQTSDSSSASNGSEGSSSSKGENSSSRSSEQHSVPDSSHIPSLPNYYVGKYFNEYEGSTRSVGQMFKWDKGTTYSWTFNLNRSETRVVLAVGAMMSMDIHSDRSLFSSSVNATDSDSFEPNPANDGTPRLSVVVNGVPYDLTNTATYAENGLNTTDFIYLPLTEFPVNAGENVIELSTHPVAGYRLYFGGDTEVRLYTNDPNLRLDDSGETSKGSDSSSSSSSKGSDSTTAELVYFGPSDEEMYPLSREDSQNYICLNYGETIGWKVRLEGPDAFSLGHIDILIDDYDHLITISNDSWTSSYYQGNTFIYEITFGLDYSYLQKPADRCHFETLLMIDGISLNNNSGTEFYADIPYEEFQSILIDYEDPNSSAHTLIIENREASCTKYGGVCTACTYCRKEQLEIDESKPPIGHSFDSLHCNCQISGELNSGDSIEGTCSFCGHHIFETLPNAKFKHFVVPTSIRKIGSQAFYGNGYLESVTIPYHVEELGYQAFYNCAAMRTARFESPTPPVIGSDLFGCTWDSSDFRIIVPQGSYAAYAAIEDEYWQQHGVPKLMEEGGSSSFNSTVTVAFVCIRDNKPHLAIGGACGSDMSEESFASISKRFNIQRNANYSGGDWTYYLENAVPSVEIDNNRWTLYYDISDVPNAGYIVHFNLGSSEEKDLVLDESFDKSLVDNGKEYRLVSGPNSLSSELFWNALALIISDAETPPLLDSNDFSSHNFQETSTALNSEGKTMTLSECKECETKDISINYADGATYKSDGSLNSSVQTKMDKGAHTEWHITVDKPISNARIYFEGTAGSNNVRYFFNQNKEVNPVNPVTRQEFPDDNASANADNATEDQWRYMVSVGEGQKLALKNGLTYAEAGAGTKPMYFTDIDLEAGDNIVKLWQMNIGYRLTFSGKVHILFEGDAVITSDVSGPDSAKLLFNNGNQKEMVLNEPALEMGFREYMIQHIKIDENSPFRIMALLGGSAYVFNGRNLKDGVIVAEDSGNESHDIQVFESGYYNVYVDVTYVDGSNFEIARNILVEKYVSSGGTVTFNWDDAIQEGSASLDSSGNKINQGTYTFKVNMPQAGRVVLSWTMMGSSGNGSRVLGGTGQAFSIKAGAEGQLEDGVILVDGKTYEEIFGADQNSWVEVEFAEFNVVAGINIIEITAVSASYRLRLDSTQPIYLDYID